MLLDYRSVEVLKHRPWPSVLAQTRGLSQQFVPGFERQ